MQLPLSSYALFGFLVCGRVLLNCWSTLGEPSLQECEKEGGPGVTRWLRVTMLTAFLNLRFACIFFLMLRGNLIREAGQRGSSLPQLLETKALDPAPMCRKIFLYDMGICFHCLVLVGSVAWNQFGARFTAAGPACDPDGLITRIYWHGHAFAGVSFLYLIAWIGGPCMWCDSPDDHPVPAASALGTASCVSNKAAGQVQDFGAPSQQAMMAGAA